VNRVAYAVTGNRNDGDRRVALARAAVPSGFAWDVADIRSAEPSCARAKEERKKYEAGCCHQKEWEREGEEAEKTFTFAAKMQLLVSDRSAGGRREHGARRDERSRLLRKFSGSTFERVRVLTNWSVQT
jgi:hypothetical protein